MRRSQIIIVLTIMMLIVNFMLYMGEVKAGANLEALFYQANNYYEMGNFVAAVEAYEHILSQGYGSGNLYYNLGNAYYRSGEKGMALANYLKARAIIPRDPDLRANLEYLQKELQLADEGGSWLGRFSNWFGRYQTLKELALLSSILFTLLVLLIVGGMYIPKLKRNLKLPIVVVCIAFMLFMLVSGVQFYNYHFSSPAVVIAQEIAARFEPTQNGEVHYVLSEGKSVYVEMVRGDWVQIRRMDGKKGWVKGTEILLVRAF